MSTAVSHDAGTVSPGAWLDANHRYLSAECARLKALVVRAATGALADDGVREAEAAVERARAALPDEAAIDAVANAFGLTPFERDVLLLAAGVEMDESLAEACAAHTGHAAGCATFGIALSALPEPHWTALGPTRPLRRWQLVEVSDGARLTQRRLRIDERVLHHLAGVRLVDTRLAPVLAEHAPPALVAESHRRLAERIAEEWEPSRGRWPVVQLHGDDRDGQADVAALVAAELGWDLRAVRAEELPVGAADRRLFATLWMRESMLLGMVLLVHVADRAHNQAVADMADAVSGPLFIASREPAALRGDARRHPVNLPDGSERRRLWHAALGHNGHGAAGLDAAASHFRLSARSIARTVPRLDAERDSVRGALAAVRRVCVTDTTHGLQELAQQIAPLATWEDLIVPEQVVATLHALAAQVRHRTTVYDAWGLAAKSARGLGITALFTGASGTGKTMAAEVIANDLGLDLYRVDLSMVVSKYIGETEKHLRRIFDGGEESGAILLFDEADALFGKRSEVKDSHDRYANIQVSYLLQRMEAYRGLAILTTNARAALDRAFQRRLRFVVQFPFPDAALRERIWRAVFPPETPTEALDWPRLAELNVPGGAIRSIAVNAAFLAADAREPVRMHHLVRAGRVEQAKREQGGVLAEGAGV
jgi:hypothetical protein